MNDDVFLSRIRRHAEELRRLAENGEGSKSVIAQVLAEIEMETQKAERTIAEHTAAVAARREERLAEARAALREVEEKRSAAHVRRDARNESLRRQQELMPSELPKNPIGEPNCSSAAADSSGSNRKRTWSEFLTASNAATVSNIAESEPPVQRPVESAEGPPPIHRATWSQFIND